MKRWLVVLIVLFIVLGGAVLSMALWPKVDMDFATECVVNFKYGDKDISQTVSTNDFTRMCDLFDDKKLYSDNLSCGFSDDISAVINGSEQFSFACDACPIVYWKNKDKFFRLSVDEYNELREILKRYGFVFPCL